jgi:hypothetical protein
MTIDRTTDITTTKIAGPAITGPFITADAAMPGVLTMLSNLITDGTIDRFHYGVEARLDAQSRNAGEMVLTVYSDGTYVVQGKHDAAYDAASVSDHVVSIPLAELSAAIRGALN